MKLYSVGVLHHSSRDSDYIISDTPESTKSFDYCVKDKSSERPIYCIDKGGDILSQVSLGLGLYNIERNKILKVVIANLAGYLAISNSKYNVEGLPIDISINVKLTSTE